MMPLVAYGYCAAKVQKKRLNKVIKGNKIALNNWKHRDIPQFCSTFAAVKQKTSVILLFLTLVLAWACTPLSLLKRAVPKEVKEAVTSVDMGNVALVKEAVSHGEDDVPPLDTVSRAAIQQRIDSLRQVAGAMKQFVAAANDTVPTDSVSPSRRIVEQMIDSLQDLSADAKPAAAALKRDTTTMDSLQLAIWKHNKAIDDSLHRDSLNRQRKNGIDSPVQFSANDSIIYRSSTGLAYLFGDSHVQYQNMDLKSEKIYLNLDSSIVHATPGADTLGVKFGSPIFKMGSDTYENDTMAFNFKTKKGIIQQVYTEQQDGFLTAEIAKRGANGEIYLGHGRYTTCDEPHPDFYLALSRAKMRPGKDVVFGPSYLVVCDVPMPFAIPYGFFPFSKSYSSGFIMPTYGDETERGFYLRNGGYYFAISDKMDLKLIGEIYTKGSWGLTGTTNYRKRYRYSGNFMASYQNSIVGEKNMPDYSKTTSFKVQWSHRQDAKANPYSTLSASVNFATSAYERNNLTSMYNPQSLTQSTRTSSVSYSTGFSSLNMNISTSMNLSQNMRDSTISMTLPDLNISISRFYPFKRKKMAGKERWYEKISMSYTGRLSNSITTKEEELPHSNLIKDWRNGMEHRIPIQGNFNLLGYISINPSFNFTDRTSFSKIKRDWDQANQRVVTDTIYGFYNVYNWNMSVSATTTLYGFLIPNRKIFGDKVDRIRHVFTPSVSFTYAPDFGANRYGYYATYQKTDANGNVSIVEYSPYEETLYRAPGKGKTGSISMSLANNLEMKIRDKNDSLKKVSLIDDLSLSMSYNMAAKVRPWSDLSANIRLKLSKSYTFNLNAVFASYIYEADSVGATPRISEHTTYWEKGKIGRFQGMSQNLSYTLDNTKVANFFKWLRGEKVEKKNDKGNEDDDEFGDEENENETNIDREMEKGKHGASRKGGEKAEVDEDGYMGFSLPWSISFGYGITMREDNDRTKFNYNTMRYPYKFTQNLNMSGNIRISDGWNISFSSGYDFENKKISMTTASLSRDLHCFSMSCSVVLAPYTSYNFSFRCNAATLTDALKYDKRSSYSNAVQWY